MGAFQNYIENITSKIGAWYCFLFPLFYCWFQNQHDYYGFDELVVYESILEGDFFTLKTKL